MYHDVVTDWSSALAGFLVPMLFGIPPANPSNFSHGKCFSIQIPFSTEVLFCTFNNYNEIQKWNVKSSIEVQDEKTCRTGINAYYYYCCYVELLYYVEFVSQYFKWQPCFNLSAVLQEQEAYMPILMVDLYSKCIHVAYLSENEELKK